MKINTMYFFSQMTDNCDLCIMVKMTCGHTIMPPETPMNRHFTTYNDSVVVCPFRPGRPGTETYHEEPYIHTQVDHIDDPRTLEELRTSTTPIQGRIEWEGGHSYHFVPVEMLFIGKHPGWEMETPDGPATLIHYGEYSNEKWPAQRIKLLRDSL